MHEHTHVKPKLHHKSPRKLQRNLLGEEYYLEELDKTPKSPPSKANRASFSLPKREPIPQITVPDHLHHFEVEPACCAGYIMGQCELGHHFAKAILCGKEFCVDCGEDWSWVHQRRHYRWLPKVKSMRTMGYLVVTLPPAVRQYFLDKDHLNQFRKYLHDLMKREGFERGLSRWHWCGSCKVCKGESRAARKACVACEGTGADREWHPHINLLFPGGWMSQAKLTELRRKITARISNMTKKPVNTIVLNYSYTDQLEKKVFQCKYVTRSTWRKFSQPLAHVIKGYRNQVQWGQWKGKFKDNSVAKLERSCCPLCDTPIKWKAFVGELTKEDWTLVKAGYYIWNYKEPDP